MKKFVFVSAIASLLAGPALAQASFEAVDENGDGAVTLTEANAAGYTWTDAQFKLADTNGDGSLDADEFAAATR